VKLLRDDFWYWFPAGGYTEIATSFLFRLIVKIVTDFTSLVQFRHPNEVGGAYWLFGFLMTMGSLPITTILVESLGNAERGIQLARTIVMFLIPFALLCAFLFVLTIDKKYLPTFYGVQKGNELTIMSFRNGTDDVKAKYTFKYSKKHWKTIEGEVKAWVEANWERWVEEKPDWFDKAMRARVPVEYIPESGNARRRESVRRAGNDADDEGGLADSLRSSIRRASAGGADGGDIIGVGGGKAKVSSVVPKDEDEA
jgi:hypothetical protein